MNRRDEIVSFGEWLRRRRQALDLTRAELANQVGCSIETIKKIERDERRPSGQIAAIMSRELAIPEDQKQPFLQMARGKFVGTLPSPLIGLETSYQAGPIPKTVPLRADVLDDEMVAWISNRTPPLFVGRENALAQLSHDFTEMMRGAGKVVFLAGEAGSGKTALSQAFSTHIQETHPDVLVALGYCHVHSGVGDPLLPIRDLFDLLTCDFTRTYKSSLVSLNQMERLVTALPGVIQALLAHGPALVGTLVNSANLYSKLDQSHPDGGAVGRQLMALKGEQVGDLEQSHLFEQILNVLGAIAREKPLLIILEDLHWADTASLDLLFLLGKRLRHHRVFLLGTYRPEEITAADGDKRHPLEKVLTEFKRDFGQVAVDLNEIIRAEGVAFVNAYLDSEQNLLGSDFREALFEKTGGQPLFTTELLRAMQEEGSLIRDAEGAWIASSEIAWHSFPARVEGVIEERIGRLAGDLQYLVSIASVEGEDFCAQTLAHVLDVDVFAIVTMLSQQLGQKHRLVEEIGSQTVAGIRLNYYCFRHNLFRQYLYQRMGIGERETIHGAVGIALETCFAEEKHRIALPLAEHFALSGYSDKALAYFILAGDEAARVHAYGEAISSYARAIALVEDSPNLLADLYGRRGHALERNSQFDECLVEYERLERLAETQGDRALHLEALIRLSQLRCRGTPLYDADLGEALCERAMSLARETGEQLAEAKTALNLMWVFRWNGRATQAVEHGKQALSLARELNDAALIAETLVGLAHTYGLLSQLELALELLDEATTIWRDVDNPSRLADALATYAFYGKLVASYDRIVACSEEAFALSSRIGDLWNQSYSLIVVGNVYWAQGKPGAAIQAMELCLAIGEKVGFTVPQVVTLSELALLYGELGQVNHGLELVQQSLETANEVNPISRIFAGGVLTRLYLLQNEIDKAQKTFDQYDLAPAGQPLPPPYTHYHLADIELLLEQENYQEAIEATKRLLVQLEQLGAKGVMAEVLHLQGQSWQAVGRKSEAQVALSASLELATLIGSQRLRWRSLFSLSQLEDDPALRKHRLKEAQSIVTAIADNTDSEELQTSFLAMPKVRPLFA